MVSLSAGILSAGFAHLIRWDDRNSLLFGLFSFFGTMAVYNGQRLFKVSDIETPWLSWVRKNMTGVYILTVVSSAISLFLGLVLIYNKDVWYIALWMTPAVIISFLYVFRMKGKNLRDIPHLKIHLIAFSWVCILILFPYFCGYHVDWSHWKPFVAIIVAHYAYVFAVTIPFDIRDLKYDKSSQKTVPQVIGVWSSKALSVLLLIAAGVLMIYWMPIRIDNYWFYAALLVQMGLIIGMHSKRSDLYCAGWIDGAIALLGLAYLMN